MDRGLCCLGLGDHLADVGQLSFGSNGGCADDQCSRGVEGPSGDRATRGYFAGKRFTCHERGIQSAGALFNDAIGCNLVSGANLEEVSDAKFSCGDGAELAIRATSFNEDCVLRTELKKRTQGITGVVARPCLHQAAGQKESNDCAGTFEVDFRMRCMAARGDERHMHPHADHACAAKEQGIPRPQARGDDTEGDQGIHGRRAVAARLEGSAMEGGGTPDHDG